MPRHTPFHPRTAALCHSYAWKEWAGQLAVCNYDRHSEREYFAFRHNAGLIDVSPLYKYDVRGPDAADFLAHVWTRDCNKLKPGRMYYGAMCNEDGHTLDDGTIANLGEGLFRATTSEPWLGWYGRHSRGFDVSIEDVTDRIAALSLQGPLAREILQGITDADLDALRFFGITSCTVAGQAGHISRTGYTGDLGYEIWVDPDGALPLWDALQTAGAPFGMQPAGLDAMDVTRIEAGFVLQGVDYVSAKSCITESLKSTPDDASLGWTVKLDREGWIGRDALLRERDAGGSKWQLVGLEIDWAELEQLYDSYKLPPHLAPHASRAALPVWNADGKQVGQATSSTWSPQLKRYIALAQVHRPYAAEGTALTIEHTPEFERHRITATVVDKPFYNPPQKTFTPAKAKAKKEAVA
ncbi:MAG: aminomethyltransferase family protein [Deltaproteobacteria bacterium]|nr:aminomethyltransferase family protein [Deltaproteobacteria bacterium]